MNKEKFIEFTKKVIITDRAINKLGQAFGGACFYDQKFSVLLNDAGSIAFALLGFEDENSGTFNNFIKDFWDILDEGYTEFEEDGNKVVLNNWEDFYDYYTNLRKEKQNDDRNSI